MLSVLMNPFVALFVKDQGLIQQYSKIWDNISNAIQKGFDCDPVYDGINLKAKIKLLQR